MKRSTLSDDPSPQSPYPLSRHTLVVNARLVTLGLAVDLFVGGRVGHEDAGRVVSTAERFWDWVIDRPEGFNSFIGLPYRQDMNDPYPGYMKEFLPMAESINLADDEQVAVAIEADDSKGYAVTDALTWTSDTPNVVGLQVAADSSSALFVAGQPGNATVTATDGNLSEIYAVTVSPGAAATFKSTVGTPEKQPSSAPATPPSDTVTTPPPADSGSTSASDSTTSADSGSSGASATTAPGPGAPDASGVGPPAQVG